jgi:hypothetical protein
MVRRRSSSSRLSGRCPHLPEIRIHGYPPLALSLIILSASSVVKLVRPLDRSCGKLRPIGRLATLSDVTVVTLDLTLYSPHEWRSHGDKDTGLEHLCGRLSRCEEESK